MSYCEVVKLPGGGTAIMRFRGKPPAPCEVCGKTRHTKLCDALVVRGGRPGTCDVKLCDTCTTGSGKHDFCPAHKELR